MTARQMTCFSSASEQCRRGQRGIVRFPSNLAIVEDYIRVHRSRAAEERAFYSGMPHLRAAISAAGMALMPNLKRSPHQYRIARSALKLAERRLQQAHLQDSRTFDELFRRIDATVGPLHGIGPLYVYDTALRIGAFLNLKPTSVYLHAGTRVGAVMLFRAPKSAQISPDVFPTDFSPLEPHEIEDLLCIYKDRLHPV